MVYATPAVTVTSTLSLVSTPQSSAVPTLVPFRFTWKRSPALALPFGHTLFTVTFGVALRVFVMVQVSCVPPRTSATEVQPPLNWV